MEVVSPPNPKSPLFLSNVSPFTPKFSIKTFKNRHPYIFKVPSSIFLKNRPFSCYLLFSNTRTIQVSAHFDRPSRRRNSLREKLINDPQVRQSNPISLNPSSSENLDHDNVRESSSNYCFVDGAEAETRSVKESKLKSFGESVLLSKLENWIDQYKKDVDYWGISSGPIFTGFQVSEGDVKKVPINEDDFMKRSSLERHEFEDLNKVDSKFIYAKSLARDMEGGENVIPRNSSVAKFVVSGQESGFVDVIQGVILRPELIPKVSRTGSLLLCGLVIFWVARKLISFGKKEVHYTELEKEMMRRKIKSRKEKEMLEKGSVEVVQEIEEPPVVTFERPKMDKEELMKNIIKAKASEDKLTLVNSSSSQHSRSKDNTDKITEIRKMARRAREIESGKLFRVDNDKEEELSVNEELYDEVEVVKQHNEENASFLNNLSNGGSEPGKGTDGTAVGALSVEAKSRDSVFANKVTSFKNEIVQTSSASSVEILRDCTRNNQDSPSSLHLAHTKEAAQSYNTLDGETCKLKTDSLKMKPRVIRSVKEAREFLSKKHNKTEVDQSLVKTLEDVGCISRQQNDMVSDRMKNHVLDADDFIPAMFGGPTPYEPAPDACGNSNVKDEEYVPNKNGDPECPDEVYRERDGLKSPISVDHEDIGGSTKKGPSAKMEGWMEKNFRDIEPMVKKIGSGFRDNFTEAREKVSQQLNTFADITQLASAEDDSELEWMKDDRLREIVFQVRENELAGLDPFYMMDAEDKLAFFQGLEKKVEKENEKLLQLHEYLHSNIENLDYGADGISLYDAPEKIIPRWKGAPLKKSPEFLDDFLKQRKTLFTRNNDTSFPLEKDENFLENSTVPSTHKNVAISSSNIDLKKKLQDKDSKNSKTVVEGSDGSVRPGKRHGKEYWQHTKKWSREFLESYNAETDPEVKSVMKDIGKDLDRWITEEEIKEAADLMTKSREMNKKFIEKKINKIKREMELFGPQAVVSKYREYAEDKEEDYLWWLDLPHVLCIELYTVEGGQQRIGFYSLEMAADLELKTKPYHVIAFEDAWDCKNLCYIIQGHLDMLGTGHAFVVPRPPKDAFREAKANGFSVTVIRRGELQLNVDQTLEEVEEQITEIGSKIYHDKITKERSVDISSIMKGVLGVDGKPTKRKRAKRKLKRPGKK